MRLLCDFYVCGWVEGKTVLGDNQTPLMMTSGQIFSFISMTVLVDEALSVGSSIVLTLVLGRLLL